MAKPKQKLGAAEDAIKEKKSVPIPAFKKKKNNHNAKNKPAEIKNTNFVQYSSKFSIIFFISYHSCTQLLIWQF